MAYESQLSNTHERHRQQARASFPRPATSSGQACRTPGVPTQTEPQREQHDLSDASSGSNPGESIPNPPILGDPAPSVDALFAWVNSFAKSHGFGVVKAHSMVRPGRWSRCIFQCDRYGTPRPGRGAGLRKRKSRKSGCLWKIVAEALPENDFQWTLRHFPKVEHHQYNHKPSSDAAAHPAHRRLTSPVKATDSSVYQSTDWHPCTRYRWNRPRSLPGFSLYGKRYLQCKSPDKQRELGQLQFHGRIDQVIR